MPFEKVQDQLSVFQEHYPPLVIAYLVGLGGWLVANRLVPRAWPREPIERFARPWREFGMLLWAPQAY